MMVERLMLIFSLIAIDFMEVIVDILVWIVVGRWDSGRSARDRDTGTRAS
jgi:hypothetical protein